MVAFDITKLSEREFQKIVLQDAHVNGWYAYHNPDSRRSQPGFPDLVLIREPEIMFVELKKEKGRLSDVQEIIISKLQKCGLEVHVWRPSQLGEIRQRLIKRGHQCSKEKLS